MDDIPVILIDGVAFDVGEIFDKTLIATQTVNVRRYKSLSSNIVRTVQSGETVGVVLSYVNDDNGDLWWMLYDGNFVKHGNFFSLKSLEDQGAESEADKQAADELANADFPEKIFLYIKNFVTGSKTVQVVIYIAIALLVLWGVVKIYKTYKS